MNKNIINSAAAASLATLLLASCASEDLNMGTKGETKEITVKTEITVNDPVMTRTSLDEEEGNLVWAWEMGDIVVATDTEGIYKGFLTVIEVDEEEPKKATFEGGLNVSASETTTTERMVFHYLGKGFSDYASLRGAFNLNVAEQSGDIADLVKNDILMSDQVIDVKVNQNFNLIPSFSLGHVTSVGHFSITLPDDEEVATVTVSGNNLCNTVDINLGERTLDNKGVAEGTKGITVKRDDFYITLIPNENVTFHFDVVSTKGNNYVADLCYTDSEEVVEFDLEGGMFLRKNAGFGGLAPTMTSGFSYVLSFDANGGEAAPETITAAGPGAGAYEFTIPVFEMKKGRNYDFIGWKDGSSETLLAAGATVSVTKDEPTKTLVAQWEQKRANFNISYNKNAGSDDVTGMPAGHGSNLPMGENETVYTFNIAPIPPYAEANYAKPVREGYEFLGWKAGNEGETLASGAEYTLTEPAQTSVVFYAQWAEKKTFTLSFNANATGLSVSGTAPQDMQITTIENNVTFEIPDCNLSVSGLVFLGWSTSANAAEAEYAAGDKFQTSETDNTLYGVWGQGNSSGSGGNLGGFDPTDPSNRQ